MENNTIMINENSDQDRVFSLPNPGGIMPNTNYIDTQQDQELISSGSNPLLKEANPLLNLICQIRTLVQVADPDELKKHLVAEIKKFDTNAKKESIIHEHALIARYCLCTVLDETAAKTPWGKDGNWSKHSLLVIFHNETWGGEKFFQLLAKALENPEKNLCLIELMYYCISFGFQGRYNVANNGEVELENIRLQLADKIRRVKGERNAGLSVNWQGETKNNFKIWNTIPIWFTGIFSIFTGAGVFLILLLFLSDHADRAFMRLANLTLPEPPRLYREHVPSRLSEILAEEISKNKVTVSETSTESKVTIQGDGLFESASSRIKEAYIPTLERIGQAINQLSGEIEVVGHTDNLPIRTLRYPSNWELSVDRANTVADILKKQLSHDRDIFIQGKASAKPIADNKTAEGRSLNRRVEIILYASTNK